MDSKWFTKARNTQRNGETIPLSQLESQLQQYASDTEGITLGEVYIKLGLIAAKQSNYEFQQHCWSEALKFGGGILDASNVNKMQLDMVIDIIYFELMNGNKSNTMLSYEAEKWLKYLMQNDSPSTTLKGTKRTKRLSHCAGLYYYKKKQYSEATKWFQNALPQCKMYYIAKCDWRLHRYKSALNHGTNAYKSNPIANYGWLVVKMQLETKQYVAAITTMKDIITQNEEIILTNGLDKLWNTRIQKVAHKTEQYWKSGSTNVIQTLNNWQIAKQCELKSQHKH